ncbi:hypothetical protein AC579_39 [Pseudocercospora musae]|uniref:Uncharacterized protein n=1 Tax=Pseudocercospora musae TaxID=113226 RepID=A0A139IGG1_9PEZI|nr:hypothetical protein AC579_39 [Pseudocercospora musae]
MSQQHSMQMGGMGGPVGGPPVANAGTPNSAGVYNPDAINKKLNTAIYDYLLCNEKYDVARAFHKEMQIEYADSSIKQSPNQRQNQANGVDGGIDMDGKEHHGIRQRPSDLPAPQSLSSEDSPFLQDWWCMFWELHSGNRQKGKPTTLSYVGQQRQQMKQRAGLVTGVDPNSMRPGYNMMNNGMGGDLRQAAMKNGMTQQAMAAQQMKMQQQRQGGQMQGGNQMERQGSQMNMSDPRSGSPNTGGDAPSPKRQRLDGAGNMQQMNQARSGQQPQMQGQNQVGPTSSIPPHSMSLPAETRELLARHNLDPNNMSREQLQRLSAQPTNVQAKSVEVYSQAMQQQMQSAMQRASSSNANKGMPQNPAMGPGGAQSSPMTQENFNANGELYSNSARTGMPQNGAMGGGQQGANNGNHALQDYQMQLMLLEQQSKKRLLMARQEQDSMAHPTGVPGPNGGKFAPEMSREHYGIQRDTPNFNIAGMCTNGDMTGRGSPQPGMMDPSNPAMQPQMMRGPNGQVMMRPPSSHPMPGGQMTAQQLDMLRQQQAQQGQMMPNGANWQQGGPQPPGQMMPGQQPGQPGPPGQPPNMTPRQGNMPPPPAPANAAQGGTQPSSPAQPPAPPTPSQQNKSKPGAKKAAENKKGPAAAKKDENAPPTPTPPPPVTPNNAASFNQNKNVQGMPNGQPNPGQQQNQQQGNVGQPSADMGMAPFGDLSNDQNNFMDFANIESGDVLDNFDFDSFLNNTGGDEGLGFDANFAFGDGIEADIGGN